MSVTEEFARHVEAEARIATALVDLDGHPGYRALLAGPLSGRTAERWAAATAALGGLWADFAQFRAVTAAAGAVRARRARPGAAELAELRRLLIDSSIEVARTPVALSERGLAGPTEHVETVTLQELRDRMEAAFRELSELVVTCDAVRTSVHAAVGPLAEQLRAARELGHALGLGSTEPEIAVVAALTSRLTEVERLRLEDPLALDERPPDLAGLAADTAAATTRLRELAAVREGWDRQVADLAAELAALDVMAGDEAAARTRAQHLIAGTGLTEPLPRSGSLRDRLTRLAAAGWPERLAGLTELRAAVRSAADELRAATAAADELVERRRDLRGRFEAYQAKAVRLGLAEHPALLAGQERLRALLWTSPCDLAAATRALREYQQLARGGIAVDQGSPA